MTEKKKTAEPDLQAIVPENGIVTIDGVQYRVKRLRLLELAALMRIVTVGAGPALPMLADMQNEDDFLPQAMGVVIVSLPNAVEQVVEFLQMVLEPVDSDASKDGLVNPDPDAFLDVVSVILDQEKDEFPALVGKARRLWEVQVRPLIPTGSQT